MAQRAGLPTPTEEARLTPVHMLWSEKPCNMNCWNGGFEFQDAIRSDEVEFFVTNHQWMENDSLFADLVLPVTTCVEDDDTMGASMTVGMCHAGYTPRACDRVGESKSDWDILVEKGLYYPKLEENWRDEIPGMRGFYEDSEKFPLNTPFGKLEFYSQAPADNFLDDKERQPIAMGDVRTTSGVCGGEGRDGGGGREPSRWARRETARSRRAERSGR